MQLRKYIQSYWQVFLQGKYQETCIIYEVKCMLCDEIYIGNTKQTSKKRMDGHFFVVQLILRDEQKPDSFAEYDG